MNTPQHGTVKIDLLVPNPENPNKMSKRQFNMLVDNLQRVGLTDPILVKPLEDGRYLIVGGEHRWKAAKFLEYTEVPVTIVDLDEDEVRFQTMRHNLIKGKLDAEKFLDMYGKVQAKYSREQLADLFGFEDEAELAKIVDSMAKQLPKDLQVKFKEAAKEVKTINGLAQILNHLFATYGSTMPYGYMVLDYGGEEHIWVRLDKKSAKDIKAMVKKCTDAGKSFDSALLLLIKAFNSGKEVSVAATLEQAALAEVTDVSAA